VQLQQRLAVQLRRVAGGGHRSLHDDTASEENPSNPRSRTRARTSDARVWF
jgi:hypothetical protein